VNPTDYWLIRDGEKIGPFPLGEIARRIRADELTEKDPAWHAGMSSWSPLGEIAELRAVFDEDKIGGITAEEETGHGFPPPPGPPAPPMRTPVFRRFWARWLDIQTYGALWWLACGAAGQDIKSFYLSPWMGLVMLVPWFLIEAVCIHSLGTTPGKALLGLRVVNRDGSRLSLGAALRRSLRVLVMGIGFGWSLLCPICQALAWFTVRRTGDTLWDLSGGHKVEARPASGWRIAMFVFCFFTVMQIEGAVLAPVIVDLMGNDFPWLRKAYEQSLTPPASTHTP